MNPSVSVFGYEVSSYLLLAAAGLLAGLLLGEYTRRKIGLSRRGLLMLVLSCVPGGVIGAKLLYILVEWNGFLSDPVFVLTHGGFVFYGGLLGAFLAAWVWCRHTKTPYLPVMDSFAPCVTLFHAFGRVGCLLAGCCYGIPAEACFGIVYPPGGIAPAGTALIPVPVYEAGFLLILTAVLLILLNRSETHGKTFGTYLTGYAVWRFFIEFFRGDPRGTVFGLSTSQFISIFVLLGGLMILLRKRENFPNIE